MDLLSIFLHLILVLLLFILKVSGFYPVDMYPLNIVVIFTAMFDVTCRRICALILLAPIALFFLRLAILQQTSSCYWSSIHSHSVVFSLMSLLSSFHFLWVFLFSARISWDSFFLFGMAFFLYCHLSSWRYLRSSWSFHLLPHIILILTIFRESWGYRGVLYFV